MESSASAVANPAGPEPTVPARRSGIVRCLYTNNPFYVISAALVFYGLRVSFNHAAPALHNGTLIALLAGYTLLLAGTAYLLIRLGRVWDDARSLFLLVVMMFLALSVTFDDSLVRDAASGRWLDIGGLALAVGISEWLLRGLGIRLRVWYLLPYYLTLALFFFYPVAVSTLIGDPHSESLQWALFGFSPAAGLVALSLLPAVRRGRDYVNNNGTPWPWPLFPWSLYFVLGFSACLRSYYLCVSLHFASGTDAIFGLYFLVPLLGAVAVLLLEAGIVSRSQALAKCGLAITPLLVLLASMGEHRCRIYTGFLSMFQEELHGTPLFLTLLATVGFYALATVRRVRSAHGLLFVSLLALSFYRPDSVRLGDTVPPAWVPVVMAGVLQLATGVWRRQSFRTLAGAALARSADQFRFPRHMVQRLLWLRADKCVLTGRARGRRGRLGPFWPPGTRRLCLRDVVARGGVCLRSGSPEHLAAKHDPVRLSDRAHAGAAGILAPDARTDFSGYRPGLGRFVAGHGRLAGLLDRP